MNFFKKPSPSELMREQERQLRKTQREMQRSQQDLERQEKQLEADIKKAAKQGDKQLCTLLAKNLVRLRNQKARVQQVKCQVNAIGTKAKVVNANQKLGTAMQTATKAIGQINKQTQPSAMANTLREFSKQNQMMDMKQELVDETLSSVLDESGDEEEQDQIVNQVLDEIGIEITGKLNEVANIPKDKVKESKTNEITEADIEAQLAKLRM